MAVNFKISYDAQPNEIEKSYSAFQTKYLLKKKLIYTVVYIIVIVLGIDLLLKNPQNPAGYIATGLAAGILVFNWIKPYLVQKKLLKNLADLGTDETYTMSFYDDRIEVETEISEAQETETVAITSRGVFTVEEGSEAAKEIAENPDLVKDETQVEKSVYRMADTGFDIGETDELLMLFVNRTYIHTIPKRCLSESDISSFKEYFADKGISI